MEASHTLATRATSSVRFENSFTCSLPADKVQGNHIHTVNNACYSRVLPTPVAKPELIIYSPELVSELQLQDIPSDEFAEIFTGNRILEGMDPYASCYGGHQFGHWAGQLGDGRVINLGEVINQYGTRQTVQLKGAGLTPYSRMADGRAVLRSSLREFLCSEAMYYLGVPTTRALSLAATGEQVARDMFYNGNQQEEPGAIVCRVAESFIRFGNFQLLYAQGNTELLRKLVDYTICHHFPSLGEPSVDVYIQWFQRICVATAHMIVDWQRVGFVHGVMNTDNMSILGLTIDYGPYGWMDNYDTRWTPNTTDAHGRRYCFGNQAYIGHWNLAQLAQALTPIIGTTDVLQEILDSYVSSYQSRWNAMMAAKLGLQEHRNEDSSLINELLAILQLTETDMTLFFRALAHVEVQPLCEGGDAHHALDAIEEVYYRPDERTEKYNERMHAWLMHYAHRIASESKAAEDRITRMNSVNPLYVLRNYMAQNAIDAAEQGDHSLLSELFHLLQNPYTEQDGMKKHAQKRPDWARNKPGCSTLSCSS